MFVGLPLVLLCATGPPASAQTPEFTEFHTWTDIATIVKKYKGRTFGFASRNFYASFLAAVEVDRNAVELFGDLLGLDYVDLVYCHRADPTTPIEETVWAMHNMIERGKALYWGTSEWEAGEILSAIEIAERHHLHKPVVEQPMYNLFERHRFAPEYDAVYADKGYGSTIWSPLASGLLTGKYQRGIPEGSRGSFDELDFLKDELTDADRIAKVAALEPLASDMGASLAQFALAWCLQNPHVSSVITGASRGIGKAIGLRAAREGANVVIAAKTTTEHPKLPGTIFTAAEEMTAAGGRARSI